MDFRSPAAGGQVFGRMHSGAGPATLLAAAAGWDRLAGELHTAAGVYQSVISALTDGSWTGASSTSVVAAVTPYLTWMRSTAAHCEEAASHAIAAAGAYETAFAMTVPPPMITANRVQLATLIATNNFGHNTPAIMATEAEYGGMPRPRTPPRCTATRQVPGPRRRCRISPRRCVGALALTRPTAAP